MPVDVSDAPKYGRRNITHGRSFSSYSGGYGGSTDLPYSDNYGSYGGSQSCGGVYPIQNHVRSDFLRSEDDNIPFAAYFQEVTVETSARSDFLRNEDDNIL